MSRPTTPKEVRDINRAAWDGFAEQGDRWSTPVSPEEIAAARRGEWHVCLTESRPAPREWFPDLEGNALPFSSLDTCGEAWLRENGEAAEYDSLEAQLGGRLEAGFVLTHLLESHREQGTSPEAELFPSYIATRSVKPAGA